jgi:predicted DCC family thiol-disulfide oxidoreductase YuxK
MITVFYDGKCGLCSKEINLYKKIAPAGIFIWQDITESMEGLKAHGVNLSDGLRRLHAKDDQSALHIGVDAFILIWKQLKYWRILGLFVSLPLIRHLANFAYNIFADWRFKKLEHCQVSLKNENRKNGNDQ